MKGADDMEIKYDIGDKVILKAVVRAVHADERGTTYTLTVYDDNVDWGCNNVQVSEKMLLAMNEKGEDNE